MSARCGKLVDVAITGGFALLILVLHGNAPCTRGDEPRPTAEKPAVLEALLTDDSSLKLILRDERIGLTTPYGKLQIPTADICRIEFATRVPEEMAKRIEAALSDLGNSEFRKREAATAELSKLGERVYPSLKQATKSSDREVVHRAEQLIEKLEETYPPERLEVREHDVVYTKQSKFAGRLDTTSLKAESSSLGEVTVQLHDLRSLMRPRPKTEVIAANVANDPGSLMNYSNQVGKTFDFRVTGGMPGVNWGAVWGTDVYTADSSLAMAAVHAGVLKPGETGVVRVKIVRPPAGFIGSSRNGVTSGNWANYPGAYEVHKPESADSDGC